jgi:hypothetical protein
VAKSRYCVQVVHLGSDKVVASWPPGLEEERDFVSRIVEQVQARGVGVLKTETQVLTAVRDVLDQAFFDLKAQVIP